MMITVWGNFKGFLPIVMAKISTVSIVTAASLEVLYLGVGQIELPRRVPVFIVVLTGYV